MIVKSSYIFSVEFIEPSNTLVVEFKRGKDRIWHYSPITREGFNALLNAESVGAYFAANIKNNPDIEAVSKK